MLLKAGTYRFNDSISFDGVEFVNTGNAYEFNSLIDITLPTGTLTLNDEQAAELNSWAISVGYSDDAVANLPYNITFSYVGIDTRYFPSSNNYTILYYNLSTTVEPYSEAVVLLMASLGASSPANSTEIYSGVWNTPIYGGSYQPHTITEDTEVDDTFGTWYISNTNYNEVNPTEDTEYIEVASWYTRVANAIRSKKGTSEPINRDNFASEIESIQGGGSGECSGNHVIEVEELPTENIDKSAVYKVGDTLNQYNDGLADVIIYMGGAHSMGDSCSGLYSVSTKPTANVQISNMDTGVIYLYYVKDENNIFLYGDFSGTGTNSWITLEELYAAMGSSGFTFKGIISDVSEATETGYYAQIGGWIEYLIPTGTFEITEDGTYDVTDKKEVTVKAKTTLTTGYFSTNGTYSSTWADGYSEVTVSVPTTAVVQTSGDLPTDAPDGSFAIVLEG